MRISRKKTMRNTTAHLSFAIILNDDESLARASTTAKKTMMTENDGRGLETSSRDGDVGAINMPITREVAIGPHRDNNGPARRPCRTHRRDDRSPRRTARFHRFQFRRSPGFACTYAFPFHRVIIVVIANYLSLVVAQFRSLHRMFSPLIHSLSLQKLPNLKESMAWPRALRISNGPRREACHVPSGSWSREAKRENEARRAKFRPIKAYSRR